MEGESSLLSLNTAGSSMNAALGGVSAGGVGTPLFDVTQRGGSPSAFVASHPTGNIGGVTLSKFSLNARGTEHLPGQVSVLSICAVVRSAAPPPTITRTKQTRWRNRVGGNVRAKPSVIASGAEELLLLKFAGRCQFFSEVSYGVNKGSISSSR